MVFFFPSFFLTHFKPITLMRPVQQGIDTLPPVVCQASRTRLKKSVGCAPSDLTFSFHDFFPVPAQSAPEAPWHTCSRPVFLKSWTAAGRLRKSWTRPNLCPSILSGRRLTSYRETCWSFSFWHLPGNVCSAVTHTALVSILILCLKKYETLHIL